jgi:DtxR family transcriptional regulator, Mn-dependent transcriptional regulator
VSDALILTAAAARDDGLPGSEAPAAVVTEVLEVLLERHGVAPVGTGELVDRIPVPAAQVHAAVQQLLDAGEAVPAGDGLVEDGVTLSEQGRHRAVGAVRRHRLVERMLADLIGLDWWKVHHEAVRFEGVISADVEAALIAQLGDPGTCPHGNPIPGSRNQPDHPDAVLLADAPVGPVHVVRITETLEGDDEALQLLQECGFLPGRDAEVKDRRDGWVEVAGTVHDAAFPQHIAAHTYVAPR